MIRNLAHADAVVKVALAVSVLVCDALGVIDGPFARALSVLSAGVLVLFVVQVSRRNRKN